MEQGSATGLFEGGGVGRRTHASNLHLKVYMISMGSAVHGGEGGRTHSKKTLTVPCSIYFKVTTKCIIAAGHGTFDCLYSQTWIVYSPFRTAVTWSVGSSECCY